MRSVQVKALVAGALGLAGDAIGGKAVQGHASDPVYQEALLTRVSVGGKAGSASICLNQVKS